MTTVTFHQVSSPEGHHSFVKSTVNTVQNVVKAMISSVENELTVRAAIRALRNMDDRTLADIGICRGEINAAVRGRRAVR